jgi:hypothetical protein
MLNKGSYGDTDGQLITLFLCFRVTSAEHQKGAYIVNITDIIEASIGGYVGNTGGLITFLPYTYFRPCLCQSTVKHFSLYDFPFHPIFKNDCYATNKIHHRAKKSTNAIQ